MCTKMITIQFQGIRFGYRIQFWQNHIPETSRNTPAHTPQTQTQTQTHTQFIIVPLVKQRRKIIGLFTVCSLKTCSLSWIRWIYLEFWHGFLHTQANFHRHRICKFASWFFFISSCKFIQENIYTSSLDLKIELTVLFSVPVKEEEIF